MAHTNNEEIKCFDNVHYILNYEVYIKDTLNFKFRYFTRT